MNHYGQNTCEIDVNYHAKMHKLDYQVIEFSLNRHKTGEWEGKGERGNYLSHQTYGS
jgi:hypothetical protein